MQGSWPSQGFLARIRRGEIGGIFLFQNNIPPQGLAALVKVLQAAARAGGQPPLLVATDQEGGQVRRLPGPPQLAPNQMTTTLEARTEGKATGRYLARFGINTDLAPVLDVPESPHAFIASRTFATTPSLVATRGLAFAHGLADAGILATAKHFPGLGGATVDTDSAPSIVATSRTRLLADMAPFAAAVRGGIKLVMVSTAIYPTLGSDQPAACTPGIVDQLLRIKLKFDGAIVSDDLGTNGVMSVLPLPRAIVAAARAGVDLLYVAGPSGKRADALSTETFTTLLAAAHSGQLTNAQLQRSYERITSLKRTLHY